MSQRLRLIVALTVLILAATTAVGLAAKPEKGKTYTGDTAHEQLSVTVKVSSNGKTATVNIPDAPLYCQGGGGPVQQVTKPAKISSGGSFSGTIGYQFEGKIAYKVTFKGKFATKTVVSGSVRSEYKSASCNGSTAFTAEVLPAG